MKQGAVILSLILYLSPGPILFGQQPERDLFIKEYKIGPKDLLEIKVFELPELNQTVRVEEDGSISLPLLGKVAVAGQTKDGIERKLASLLEAKYLNNAQVSVFIREYQSKRVAVIGAVKSPGMYEIIGRQTLLQMLTQAGGYTENAGQDLFLMREGKGGLSATLAIDLEDLVINGNAKLNVPLQPNDVVHIPPDKIIQIYVWGMVKSPGAYEVNKSKNITVFQAIAKAGGTVEGASKSGVIIKRFDKDGNEVRIPVNLNDIIKGRKPDILLKDGDVVFVPESFW